MSDGNPSAATRSRSETESLLVVGMGIFGSAVPVSRIVGREMPALLAAGLKVLVAAVVLAPVLVWWERRHGRTVSERVRQLDGRDWLLLVGVAGVGTFLYSALMLLGMRVVPGAVGAVMMALSPAVTAVGAVVFLHDRLDRRLLAAVLLGVVGVVTVNLSGSDGGGGGELLLGSLLVLGAVGGEATYTLLGKRLTSDLDMVEMAAAAAILAALLFLVPSLWQLQGFQWGEPDGGEWMALLWWGAGSMGIGSVAWFTGLARVDGSVAAIHMAVMPVSALVLSYLLLGERFSLWHLVGMGAVLGGIWLVHDRA